LPSNAPFLLSLTALSDGSLRRLSQIALRAGMFARPLTSASVEEHLKVVC
jgi:hypothetical protein